jgi:hypothetical protein
MNPDNEIPVELLPDGPKYIMLSYNPDDTEEHRWVVERLMYGDGTNVFLASGATPRAAFMAALAMIDAGDVVKDPVVKGFPMDARMFGGDGPNP